MESSVTTKFVEHAVGAVELVAGIRLVNLGLNLRETGDHELIERQQLVEGNVIVLSVVLPLELAQQEAEGVAERRYASEVRARIS